VPTTSHLVKRVKSPKFPDVFTLAPPSLFKSGLAVIAPLSGRTVRSTVGESFSFHKLPRTGMPGKSRTMNWLLNMGPRHSPVSRPRKNSTGSPWTNCYPGHTRSECVSLPNTTWTGRRLTRPNHLLTVLCVVFLPFPVRR
jgi:hypothetical protein